MENVYITGLGSILPGEPVSNKIMEEYIGRIHGQSSRLGPLSLRQNGIKQRYYALDKDGKTEWTVAKLIAQAIRKSIHHTKPTSQEALFLSAATSLPDIMLPGIASQVHGELALNNQIGAIEVASFQSVCASSMMALKMAALGVETGEYTYAMVGSGEFVSRFFRPGFYEGTDLVEPDGTLPISAEFLRWTISDGAGALILQNKPNPHALSFKIKWIHQRSFANQFNPCMTFGETPSSHHCWPNEQNTLNAYKKGMLTLQQDFSMLEDLLRTWVNEYASLVKEGRINADCMDWFLCHYSTRHLGTLLKKLLIEADCGIPEDKWFSNLSTCGNTGSGSLFIMLEELHRTKNLTTGQQVFCVVPESGRGIVAFMLLEVV
jgi:3-oxoacyl-[acyl-carrier-protein] synthase-3